MSPFLQGLIGGLLLGGFITAYWRDPAFRDRVHTSIRGFIWGSKGRKPKSKLELKPELKRKIEKTEKCIVCGQASPLSELDEATLPNKGKAWIHPRCHE